VIAARDMAIHLREKALNEHTIVSMSHPDGRIAAVNQNFVDVLGYDPDEIVGETPESLLLDARSDGEFESIRETVSGAPPGKGTQRSAPRTTATSPSRRRSCPGSTTPASSKTPSRSGRTSRVPRPRAPKKDGTPIIEALPDEVYLYDAETFRLSYANENARRRMRRSLAMSCVSASSISSTPMKSALQEPHRARCCRANARARIWRSTT
jgi:two-component system sensor histidine kinase VicK